MKISNINLSGSGEELVVEVVALAPTGGYTNVALSKVEYVTPPQDGLQEIILSYTTPTGPNSDVIVPFELSIPIITEAWFQGVKVKNVHADEVRSLRNPSLEREPVGHSGFGMEPVGFEQDKLLITVTYGGGCRSHKFQLNWDGAILKSNPPQVVLELSHNNNGDTCMALLSETLQFDLSTLEGFPIGDVIVRLQSLGRTFELPYNPTHFESLSNGIAALEGGIVGNG